MPSLTWIGKEAVLNHHKEVPYRLLREEPGLSVGAPGGILLVEGDNLEALKALLPYYAGRVKCIYIDPPYNTGNESWVYNDAVNSPAIRAWLGNVVGGEDEDLSRHDKWLCMMYPRLRLLWEFLSDQGSLWMSIDDNEIHHARAILDGIFGEQNFIATIVWQKIFSPKSSARHISANHDFILLYAKNADDWQRNLLSRTEAQDIRYNNPDDDPRGPWTSGDLSARNYYSLGIYPVACPSGRIIPGPPKGTYWRVSADTFEELDTDKRIWWGKDRNNVPRLKRFLSEVKEGLVPQTIWPHQEVGNTQEAKKEVVKLLPEAAEVFSTPKPTRLIHRILEIATSPNSADIVLDSFAGSGTTGHAVLQQNQEDGGNRRFILVELEAQIAREITAERLRRVIQGYTWTDQRGQVRQELGLGGGFRYCTLGAALFEAGGAINPAITWAELAAHIWFSETHAPWPGLPEAGMEGQPPTWLGSARGVDYYLYFDGIGGNAFGGAEMAGLPTHGAAKVVYADTCAADEAELSARHVTFRQIPYDLQVE